MTLENLKLEQLQQLGDIVWIMTERDPSSASRLRGQVETFASTIGDTRLISSIHDQRVSIDQLMADAYLRTFAVSYIGEERITRMHYGLEALRGFKRMTDRQIADEVGLPIRTITRIRHRCLGAIRKSVRAEKDRQEA